MRIHNAARKHGIGDHDMVHAYEHCLRWLELGDDPTRYLGAGPDRAGNLLEIVVLVTETDWLVIHAMRLRASTAGTLFGHGSGNR